MPAAEFLSFHDVYAMSTSLATWGDVHIAFPGEPTAEYAERRYTFTEDGLHFRIRHFHGSKDGVIGEPRKICWLDVSRDEGWSKENTLVFEPQTYNFYPVSSDARLHEQGLDLDDVFEAYKKGLLRHFFENG